MLISGTGGFGQVGLQTVAEPGHRRQRPGPGFGVHQLRVGQLIDQRVDLIKDWGVFGR